MYDLICVLPLYKSDPKVCLNMVASLARQTTDRVYYKIYYDETVGQPIIDMIKNIFITCGKKNYSCEFSENTHSGFKRNLGLEYALNNKIPYIWFVDQDDHLMDDRACEAILKYFDENPNENIIKLKFNIPEIITDVNRKIIYSIMTMPWQYVFKTSEIKDYRFNTEIEYGSDISFTVFYLVDNGYLKFASQTDPAKFIWKREMPISKYPTYYYNYFNQNSVMGTIYSTQKNDELSTSTAILQKKFDESDDSKKCFDNFTSIT